MKILVCVGARPNFMKAAPLVKELKGLPETTVVLIHTGQHYDELMSDIFFADLELPRPDVYLGIGSASQAVQTARVLERFEDVLLKERPAAVVVVGDVNSTLACALATAKMEYPDGPDSYRGERPLLAHVEAGLRSFDRTMPEEINRLVTDALADLLFVTEESAIRNLRAEGIPDEKVHFVGNVMIDTLKAFSARAEASGIRAQLHLEEAEYALVTLHRPSSVDSPQVLGGLARTLVALAQHIPVVFPAHPRTLQRLETFGLKGQFCESSPGPVEGSMKSKPLLLSPLGYLDFLHLLKHARLVMTDSGGVQEETTVLGVPCLTLRENTERPVTVTHGTNKIVGRDPEVVLAEALQALSHPSKRGKAPPLWDGQAAQRIAAILVQALKERKDR
ncbi:MAG: UDP-N-acetylglucosamine 2-epimerase (non-hydrolyzing) [Chloroflexi bacterium]|nr:UDP-N-acetylglucosamine 2-epimerase (non-hydrolyzing) [Chloroflexota bacterium]